MTSIERLWTVMVKPWVVGVFMGLMVVSFFYLDQPIAYYFHDRALEINQPIIRWLTQLGIGALYFIPLFILALYWRYIRRNKELECRAWFLWLCAVIPSVICLGLKTLLGRARPSLLFNEHVYGFYGLKTQASFWSLPSGHTSTVMGFMFGLCVLFPRYCYAFILSGLAVVSTRILLTNHYLSDVLIASYLALVEVGLLVYWLRRKQCLLYASKMMDPLHGVGT